ncbi:hypothetical protein [Gordonia rubripertincta]|uniref:Uncharacterized protein n=1 Tax=Gordonia rubripertincta TaxID=36822 RepID=A0ABT4MVZ2_GORRU|nr:hypothetical protein [Gordonia rubripertincta]MCZ4551173.1 hypothetical protein [Gordonia rubripertincta]
MLNQGLFVKLFLHEQGSVEYADVHELFASIMALALETKVTTVAGLVNAVVDRLFSEGSDSGDEDEGWGGADQLHLT